MTIIALRDRPSLAGRLSVLTGAVITLCVVAAMGATERMLTSSAIAATEERLALSSRELAASAANGIGQNRSRYAAAARTPAVVRVLTERDRAGRLRVTETARLAVRKVLARLVLAEDSGMVVELWSAKGRRVAYVGSGASLGATPENPSLDARGFLREAVRAVGADSLRISRLYVTEGRVYFWLVQPVRGRRGNIGYIAHERRIASNRDADQNARAFTGENVVIYFGNRDGTIWATVGGRPATPPLPRIVGANSTGRSHEEVLTGIAPIAGTPLQLMMQSQRDLVLAAPRLLLRRLSLVGMLLIAFGMGAALLIGRRVSGPIVAIANAAEAIARGEYDVRVPIASEAEIARLGESFNNMAIRVAAAEQTRREIAHMGRVATVAELGASIAHEVRQPLTAIRANAEAGVLLLARTPSDVAEALESFRSIVADSDRAAEVISHIRLLLRKESGTTTTVDLNDICRQAVQLLQQDAALRRTGLDLSLAPNSLSVIGDPVQLQQMVLNLTLNALDAASALDRQRQVTVSTTFGQSTAEVAIRDNGPGLPTDVQQHLFEPFFTTKTQGLGMGLAIVRSIVERHHGRVRAENLGSGGAIFRVTLPVSAPAATTGAARLLSHPPSQSVASGTHR